MEQQVLVLIQKPPRWGRLAARGLVSLISGAPHDAETAQYETLAMRWEDLIHIAG